MCNSNIIQNLVIARTNIYTSQILLNTLSELPPRSTPESLPPELHSVIELVTAQLSGHIAAEDREILSGDVTFFIDNISTICEAISTQLSTVTGLLCTICDPNCELPLFLLRSREGVGWLILYSTTATFSAGSNSRSTAK